MAPEPSARPRFAAGASRHPEPAAAVGEVVGGLTEELGGAPSVAVLFVAGRHMHALASVVEAVDTLLHPEVLVGSSTLTVVAGAEELEDEAAVALWAARDLPVVPVRLESLPGDPPVLVGLPDTIEAGSTLVLLADPATYPLAALLDAMAERHPGVDVVGGLASARGGADRNRIVHGADVLLDGGTGFLLPPGVARPVVSQGCRPIGSPWVITGADGSLVRELGGRPALERLTETIDGLSPADRAAAAHGLRAGIVAEEHRDRFAQGDFLIRGVRGADRATGAVAIGDRPEVGKVLQFQVRDAASASADLERVLEGVTGRSALLFTCMGRGTSLFDQAGHDAEVVSGVVGSLAGMFCAGELGPVGGRNAIHGYTATVLVFD